MYLRELTILNFRNIESAELTFSPNVNCFIGNNGMGKTNVLDAVYYLSFCKSSLSSLDSQNIHHDAEMAMIQGVYDMGEEVKRLRGEEYVNVSCGLRRGQKKQFRLDRKDYKRLIDHIGLIPLVLVSPKDQELVLEGSDERRRFIDSVISQHNRVYLEHLTEYNALLKQRNALLKQLADSESDQWNVDDSLLEVLELQMTPHAEYIYQAREEFIHTFVDRFQEIYNSTAGDREQVGLRYVSQLQNRNISEAYVATRKRDLILGWTSQGIHKDELEMTLSGYPLKQVGSQGQQKTYLIALKLAQAVWLTENAHTEKPILLLDDIFDKLDAERVNRIISLVSSERFGQIFITDTDRQHLTDLLAGAGQDSKVFDVENGIINQLTN